MDRWAVGEFVPEIVFFDSGSELLFQTSDFSADIVLLFQASDFSAKPGLLSG